MGDPCKQEAPIAKLAERSDNQQRALAEMAGAMKENNELLKKVALVLSDIKHLHEDGQRNERAINEVFGRVRDLEKQPSLADAFEKLSARVTRLEFQPGKAAGRAWWLIFGGLAGAAGSAVSAAIVFLLKVGATS